MQPGEADSLTYFELINASADLLDGPDYLMTGNKRRATNWQFTFDHM